jgi:hypothetical protein
MVYAFQVVSRTGRIVASHPEDKRVRRARAAIPNQPCITRTENFDPEFLSRVVTVFLAYPHRTAKSTFARYPDVQRSTLVADPKEKGKPKERQGPQRTQM